MAGFAFERSERQRNLPQIYRKLLYYDHPPIEWASGFDLQADNLRRADYIAALRAADGGVFDPLLAFVSAE